MELNEKVKNIEKTIITSSSNNRYRNVLLKILQSPPKNVIIGEWDENGDITFAIPMVEMGLNYNDYHEYEDEIFSYFILDFLGELIIRENLLSFVEKLKLFDINDYMMAIGEEGHKRFGAKTQNGKLIFKFHVSLLSEILTENLRETLG